MHASPIHFLKICLLQRLHKSPSTAASLAFLGGVNDVGRRAEANTVDASTGGCFGWQRFVRFVDRAPPQQCLVALLNSHMAPQLCVSVPAPAPAPAADEAPACPSTPRLRVLRISQEDDGSSGVQTPPPSTPVGRRVSVEHVTCAVCLSPVVRQDTAERTSSCRHVFLLPAERVCQHALDWCWSLASSLGATPTSSTRRRAPFVTCCNHTCVACRGVPLFSVKKRLS